MSHCAADLVRNIASRFCFMLTFAETYFSLPKNMISEKQDATL